MNFKIIVTLTNLLCEAGAVPLDSARFVEFATAAAFFDATLLNAGPLRAGFLGRIWIIIVI